VAYAHVLPPRFSKLPLFNGYSCRIVRQPGSRVHEPDIGSPVLMNGARSSFRQEALSGHASN
jgi:hypothetical protein